MVGEAERGLAELDASDPRLAEHDARLDSIAKGEAAKDNPERLVLARRAYDTQRYSLAARLWGEAFEADPNLAEDRQAHYRYNAACAATLAGCGQGRYDPAPDEAARAALRRSSSSSAVS